MRILVVTKYAWDDTIASGNTLSNLFSDWPDTTIYTVYCRDAKPDNNCCSHYYSVSPLNLISNIVTPWRIGHKFETIVAGNKIGNNEVEKSLTLISKKSKVFSILYDFLYSTKTWLNRRLKTFIKEANPDIVFCFGVSDSFNYFLVKYIRQSIKIPVVSYYVDDHYKTNLHFWNVIKKNRVKRLKKLALMSDKRYAISQLMCDEYSKLMKLDFDLLHKGCEMEEMIPRKNELIRLTYAGNLFYHRDETLACLAKVICDINKEAKNKAHLDIYTASDLNDNMRLQLDIDGASTLHGPKPYAEIKKILQESDVVLYVESFDKEQVEAVRYSFSTKITDCLQSGAMVLAVGPPNIASIDFLGKVPGVVLISEIKEIKNILESILQMPLSIVNRAIETNEYTKKELTIDKVHTKLQKDFNSIINSKQ